MIQAGNQGHLVPESARQVQNRDARVPGRNLFENGERIVMAPVEHINHSTGVTPRKAVHDSRKRLVESRQTFFLIVNG
jgi:hypothetical protein